MNNDLRKILANSNKDIDNQKLMDYLSGQLSKEEMHELESQMVDSDFMNDAVEGLENFEPSGGIQGYVEQLNRDLQKNIRKNKKKKDKRKLPARPWMILAILLILALMIIAFFVIRKHLDSAQVQVKDSTVLVKHC